MSITQLNAQKSDSIAYLWAIQALRNAIVGGGGSGASNFQKKTVTKVYGSTLLALRGGGWVSNFRGKSVT